MTEEKRKLTNKQRLFIDYYLQSFNASDAARKAGYSERSAREIGRKLLTNVDIKDEVQEKLAEVHMSAEEALKLLADIARADLGDFTNQFGGVDWVEAKQKGLTRLVKKWKVKTVSIQGKKEDDEDKEITTEEIELHDSLGAIRDVLKVHGKFIDRTDVTSGGEKIKAYIGISPEDWDDK